MIAALAIGRATFLELRRQRLLIVPVIAFVLSMVLLSAAIVLDGDVDGMSALEAQYAAFSAGAGAGLGASIYALIIGSSLIARELSAGTLLMLAARPVARWQIFVGRVLASGAFLSMCLLAINIAYGLVAAGLVGSTAPIDDAIRTMAFTVPAMLLALCIGAAFSVQNRPTAAIGTGVVVAVFALFVSVYATEWKREHHLRGYLVDEARDRLEEDAPVLGRAAVLVARVVPLGVFGAQAVSAAEDIDPNPYTEDGDDTIDTQNGSGIYVATEPTRPLELDDEGTPVLQPKPRKLSIDDIDGTQFAFCDSASCFYGVADAWKQRRIPAPPRLDDGSSLALAWLAIPLWALLGIGLLARRRDLV